MFWYAGVTAIRARIPLHLSVSVSSNSDTTRSWSVRKRPM